jgi:dihydroorotase
MSYRIILTKPDDWHLHVLDGDMMRAALPYTAAKFGRGPTIDVGASVISAAQ